jgi:biopolymer transport protein ExbB
MSSLRGGLMLFLILLAADLPCRADVQSDDAHLSKAVETAQQNLRTATQDLNTLRDTISEARVPLATDLQSLQNEVVMLREEVEQLRTLRYQDDMAREALDRDLARLRDAHGFVMTLLQEYRRSFETRLGVSESQMLGSRLEEIDDDLAAADATDSFASLVDGVLRLAEEWNHQRIGGARYSGTCLDGDGTELDGHFVTMGPAAYFASGKTAGLVVRRLGSSRPSLFSDLEPAFSPAITDLVAGEEAGVPLDLSGGDALKVVARKQSLKDHMVSGGMVMIPLVLIGLLALVLTIWKVASLSKLRTPADADLKALAQQVRNDQAHEAKVRVGEMNQPFRDVLQVGIDHHTLPREHLEEILHERSLSMMPILDRHLGMLAVLGGVAPLLGLLGTVTGMIHTFELVTIFGTGDARLLSGGISEALVTTEVGLVIAVPVLLIHAYLARRVRTVISELEQVVAGFLNRLYAVGSVES